MRQVSCELSYIRILYFTHVACVLTRAVGYAGAICIGVAALVIIIACCGCLIRMCWKRRKDKQFKKGVKGAVDMKSVQMLTSAMKEKV